TTPSSWRSAALRSRRSGCASRYLRNNSAWLAAFDQLHRRRERGIGVHVRGVEKMRVNGLDQRRSGARAVALVAAPDVGQDFRLVGTFAAAAQLERAATRAHLGRRD